MSQSTHGSETDGPDQQPTTSDSASTTPEPADDEASLHRYQCPYCDATYGHEYFARAHVTICDDDAHLNRNGLMPEVEIDVVSTDGDHVETVAREVRTTDLKTLTRADVPDSYTTKQATAILGAAQSPHYESRRALAEQLATEYDDSDFVPGEWTVGRAIDNFYVDSMDKSDTTSDDATDKQLADLTPLQQVAVLLQVSSPELTDVETAKRIDCSDTHVWNVRQQYADLIERLSAEYEDGSDLETIITEALPEASIAELSRAYGDALPVDIAGEQAPETESEPDTGEDAAAVERGVPSEGDVMSASPASPLPSSDEETDAASSQRRLTNTSPESTAASSEATASSDDDDGAVGTETTADAPPAESSATEHHTAATPTEKSIEESLAELRYGAAVGRGMLSAATPEADVQSQATAFAEQVEAKCVELQELHNTTE